MKRFIFSVAALTVIFLGVGAVVERTGASSKSDEKALDLIRKARLAIGGDAAVAAVKSMSIKGRTTTIINVNGSERSETGDTEIALQFPDKMVKMVKIGDGAVGAGHKIMDHQIDVVVTGDHAKTKVIEPHRVEAGGGVDKKIVIKKKDGTVQELTGAEAEAFIAANPGVPGEKRVIVRKADGPEHIEEIVLKDKVAARSGGEGTKTWTTSDGKTFTVDTKNVLLDKVAGPGHARSNDLLRTAMALLLTAPEGMDVTYTFGGESTLDGIAANVVVASFGGESFKLFLDRSSNLPVGMSFTAHRAPRIVTFERSAAPTGEAPKEMKDVRVFTRTAAAPAPVADFVVKFADYRNVGGVQLPFRWIQTVGGAADETFEVTSYDINPADISTKFDNQNVKVRMAKPSSK